MKNMFAMLCSKPAATNAEIGKTIAAILSKTVRPPVASQTARQTSAFARIPRPKTAMKDRSVFAAAVDRAVTPTAASPSRHHSASVTMTTSERAPRAFPT